MKITHIFTLSYQALLMKSSIALHGCFKFSAAYDLVNKVVTQTSFPVQLQQIKMDSELMLNIFCIWCLCHQWESYKPRHSFYAVSEWVCITDDIYLFVCLMISNAKTLKNKYSETLPAHGTMSLFPSSVNSHEVQNLS